MARMVQCVKLGQLLPGLEELPFPGEFGQRLYESVSQEAYEMWQPYSTLIINHHGLSLGNPQHRDFLMEQMEEFFFGEEQGTMPEGLDPAGATWQGWGRARQGWRARRAAQKVVPCAPLATFCCCPATSWGTSR